MDLSSACPSQLLEMGSALLPPSLSVDRRAAQLQNDRIADYLMAIAYCIHTVMNNGDFENKTALGQKVRSFVAHDYTASCGISMVNFSWDQAMAEWHQLKARGPLAFETSEMWPDLGNLHIGYATVYAHMIIRGWDQVQETELRGLGIYEFRLEDGEWLVWKFTGIRRGIALDGGY